MNDPNTPQTVRRSDLRAAVAWTFHSRRNTIFVITLFATAGLGSIFGLLRWQAPFLRWSFTGLCWILVVIVIIRALWQRNVQKANKTGSG